MTTIVLKPKSSIPSASPPGPTGGVVKTPGSKHTTGFYSTPKIKAHTTFLYGESGTLKTWNALQFAEYIMETTGKMTRYIYADAGGSLDITDASEAGLIQLATLGATTSPMAALKKFARGEWPKLNEDQSFTFQPFSAEDGEQIGAYVFDSLTSFCRLSMTEMVNSGRKISTDIVGKFEVEGESFGLVGMGHYSQAQQLVRELLVSISNLPVPRVFVTALEAKGEDDSRQTVYGPDTAGKALVDKILSDLGDTFHAAYDPKTLERRLYFLPHNHHITGIRYQTNLRLSGDGLKEWLKKFPDGYMKHGIEAGGLSIATFLKHQDTASTGNKERWAKLKAKHTPLPPDAPSAPDVEVIEGNSDIPSV